MGLYLNDFVELRVEIESYRCFNVWGEDFFKKIFSWVYCFWEREISFGFNFEGGEEIGS